MEERMRLRKLTGSLFALVIGVGYLTAVANLYFQFRLADGKPGMSLADVAIHFHGNPAQTLLATMINGPMREHLADEAQLRTIMNWIESGAKREDFAPVHQILGAQCIGCHNRQAPRPLETFEDVAQTTVMNSGMSWGRLAMVSHQHLFGLALLCLGLAWLLSATATPFKFKAIVIALGFVSTLIDIGGWWLTRLNAGLAWVVILGGALSGLFFGLGIFTVWYDALIVRWSDKK